MGGATESWVESSMPRQIGWSQAGSGRVGGAKQSWVELGRVRQSWVAQGRAKQSQSSRFKLRHIEEEDCHHACFCTIMKFLKMRREDVPSTYNGEATYLWLHRNHIW